MAYSYKKPSESHQIFQTAFCHLSADTLRLDSAKDLILESGLFAGEGGYHINADSVHLKGGAIASTAPKEQNELTANRFTFENIQNQSSYSASNVGLSGGYGSDSMAKQAVACMKPKIYR